MSGVRRVFPAKTRGDELLNFAYDEETRAITRIRSVHKMIHAGRTIEYNQYMSDVDVSKGCRIAFWITGSAESPHAHPIGGWSAGSRLEVWEDVTLTDTGTKPTLYNNKRGSTFSQSGIVFSGVSIYDTGASGTRIRSYYYGGAGGPFGMPGALSADRELILNGNQYYLFWLRPDDDNTKASIGLTWYEEF